MRYIAGVRQRQIIGVSKKEKQTEIVEPVLHSHISENIYKLEMQFRKEM